MRKLPADLENPIDNFVYIIVDFLSPLFNDFGLGPNSITTLSLISGVYSGYLAYKRMFIWAMAFYSLAYIFDCLDGYNARKYKVETKFGDYYDHFSDVFKFIMIMLGCYFANAKIFWISIPFILLDSLLVMMHLGCQEVYYGKLNSDTLNFLGKCPTSKQSQVKKYLKWTRYFGTGTSTLLVLIILLAYKIFA
tara:strand:+ start:203 stop:781 length:579 start_codon:yes stop_codon:yes gene_type:complete